MVRATSRPPRDATTWIHSRVSPPTHTEDFIYTPTPILLPLSRYTLAVTYDAPLSTLTVYVDGLPVGSSSSMVYKPSNIPAMTDFFLGRSLFDQDVYLHGELGCFSVYNRALRHVVAVVCR